MKKWVWAIVVVVVIAVVGGYAVAKHTETDHQYATALRDGRAALKDANYTQAENYFGKARRLKNAAPEATRLQNQTQKFVAGADAMQNLEFTQAKSDFTTVALVKDGSPVLVTRATSSLKTLKKVNANRTKFNKRYKKALQLNQENAFTDSNGELTTLFQNKSFKQSYYRDIYKQAVALRKQNNAALHAATSPAGASGTESSPVTPFSDSSSSSSDDSSADSSSSESSPSNKSKKNSSTSSSKASLTSSEKQAAKNYSGSNEYTVTKKQKEVNGKEITANQIKSARLDLKDAGIDEGSLSDQDIRGLIQKANKDHMSVPAAAKQLLK